MVDPCKILRVRKILDCMILDVIVNGINVLTFKLGLESTDCSLDLLNITIVYVLEFFCSISSGN